MSYKIITLGTLHEAFYKRDHSALDAMIRASEELDQEMRRAIATEKYRFP